MSSTPNSSQIVNCQGQEATVGPGGDAEAGPGGSAYGGPGGKAKAGPNCVGVDGKGGTAIGGRPAGDDKVGGEARGAQDHTPDTVWTGVLTPVESLLPTKRIQKPLFSHLVPSYLMHGYACDCRRGYRGLWCNIDIDECAVEEPCANGATCINTIASYRCLCQNGFRGPQCTELHFPCAENPCRKGGRCHPGSSVNVPHFCQCASGYSGSHCEANVDDCVNHACQNGGICEDQVNGYTCDCARPYGGQYCVDDIGYEYIA
ncbi:hypothetical protein RvY_00075 [Ramazzottius varieornatus]|uniref:EGF-like domain-containing protein n=1 Tax=Ramazzottius varieornatus TaxID=947166 RepID=A0A1D1UM14_RAMVA|nr:hypothetical protein RvY_00075 [Ramazzottius varieornatus]